MCAAIEDHLCVNIYSAVVWSEEFYLLFEFGKGKVPLSTCWIYIIWQKTMNVFVSVIDEQEETCPETGPVYCEDESWKMCIQVQSSTLS